MHIFSSETLPSKNQSITHSILDNAEIFLDIKREDQIHKDVSGNKFRKLKYNLIEAKRFGYATVLTFGGAYSNHIAATAAAGEIMGLQTIGIIRGEELGKDLEKTLLENDTLRFAHAKGMRLKFISREQYRGKTSLVFLEELKNEFGSCCIIPEGGTNDLAVKGCEEILTAQDNGYDIICSAVGTGGTISGIINSTAPHQNVIGFPALKGDFLDKEIKKYTSKTNWKLINEYHFGGYGKINKEGVEFINMFRDQQHIALDPVYTVKMIFGIFDMAQKGVFKKNTRILAIHTGGLQGIAGMNKKLKKKKLPLITIEY
ncbi:1-aminocyclopropane-1-carboxylate deaminase [Aquimarina sp. MAR_2010_214]|uniref:1-aminocyclopropane-1-carboxylate deaminase/D-cysteine desulfhydrase n=1 Tax=Aquimarina sp. MAR_2010_214 TaxID=1250026 RepID=UPI000C70B480|nr:pyridoxal-phosphate dependent enzyme [Aquimarina sp. MAR_2010_214]PKV52860.1 1-aminocyclopropane-1-carboxylate deaminase [Aquimarina sp. MAR_2010_214]